MILKKSLFLLLLVLSVNAYAQNKAFTSRTIEKDKIIIGAERTKLYFPKLKGKRIAVVANQTSMIGGTHLVDSLLGAGFDVEKVFSPEHGFRGLADAGETIKSNVDKRTGLPIVSLYGKNKKPSTEDLHNIDLVVFDIQDVGVRFYTYISTMHYVMEACAENNVEFLVLDRPNPNGFYIDGPVLEGDFKSFVGMHPVPLVHGMTIAEYAQMINGEGWLRNKAKCNMFFVPLWNYTHNCKYELPINPSPNLPNMQAVYLYPSLALFEGTSISVGRGTEFPFQVFGSPDLTNYDFSFTPKPTFGAKYPKHNGKECFGKDLRNYKGTDGGLILEWIVDSYKNHDSKNTFFNNYFYKLAGNAELKEQILKGISIKDIRATWIDDIRSFKEIREKYLLYDDFE